MKQDNEYNQYNNATRSLAECIICALETISKYGYQVVIKCLPNWQHDNPLQQPNKALDNPFNWKCTSQFHRTQDEIKDVLKRCINDTQRDLLQNWTWIFGTDEAIRIYEQTGVITKGLLNGIGRCSHVRTKDLIQYLKDNGEEERAKSWESTEQFFNSGVWVPLQGYWESAEGMTYAVYFKHVEGATNEELNKLLDDSLKKIWLNQK